MKAVSSLITLLLSMLLAAHSVADDSEPEFLDVNDAFKLTVSMKDKNTVIAHFDIEDGYYLYRDRMSFKSGDDHTVVKNPVFPEAEYKYDENFGDVYVYHQEVDITIPVSTFASSANIKVKWQGCAEAGLCYPPQRDTFELSVPQSSSTSLDQLFGEKTAAPGQPLPEDEAFQFQSRVEGNELLLEWTMPENYYLYQDKISVVSTNAQVAQPTFPQGVELDDEHFGKVIVFFNYLQLRVPVSGIGTADFTIKYQGCLKDSICYAPITKQITHELVDVKNLPATGQPLTAGDAEPETEMEGLRAYLEGNFVLMFGMFMLLGIGLALTPCVLPMVPILSSIITGQGEQLSKRSAFFLSLTYVTSMALTFALAGAIIGALGSQGTAALQNVWVLSFFAGILVALALSMFGLYKLQLPNSIQSAVTEISNRQEGGTMIGVSIMGILSALIVGPCVTAPLAAALIFIAETGSYVKGFFALLGLGVGMGIPLILVGTTAGTLVPRAGAWMAQVQHHFGFMILGLAIWMISRVMPDVYVAILWGCLLIGYGIYFNPLAQDPNRAPGWHVLGKTIGMILLLWGVLVLIGIASGGNSFTQPLKHLQPSAVTISGSAATKQEGLVFKQVKSNAELDAAIADAAAQGKQSMFDFYADWCTSCIEYEHITFADPTVQAKLANIVLIQADVTENNDDDIAMQKRFQVIGPPTIVFFDATGNEIKKAKVVGFKDGPAFAKHLDTFVLK